jgi:hypothetical protein
MKTMLLLFALSAPLHAQQGMPLQKNVVSLELLGRAGFYSTNYEHYFSRRFGAGAGVGVLEWNRGQLTVVVPVYFSARPIGNKHSLYAGAGATISRSNLTLFSSSRPYSNSVFGTASVGYQYRTAGGTVGSFGRGSRSAIPFDCSGGQTSAIRSHQSALCKMLTGDCVLLSAPPRINKKSQRS